MTKPFLIKTFWSLPDVIRQSRELEIHVLSWIAGSSPAMTGG